MMRVLVGLVFLTAVSGCKQGIGDRCQTNSDCDDSQSLICVLPAGATPQSGGTCQPPGAGLDGSVGADFAMAAPGADLSGTPIVDMATSD
jgi:hypothetical protein